MKKVLIIGAGLAGSITARLCRLAGAHVTVVDGGSCDSGSQAAACLLTPRWLAAIDVHAQRQAYQILSSIAHVHTLKFNTGVPGVKADIDWVAPADLLVKPDVRDEVEKLGDHSAFPDQVMLVATGYRAGKLAAIPEIKPIVGVSLIFPGQMTEPRVRIWAPYRQAIAFNISSSSIWFGDGTAIQQKNWSNTRIDDTVRRAKDIMGLVNPIAVQVGVRPKMDGFPKGYLAKVGRGKWVMTGGYKNGTALYALLAQRFLKEAVCV